MKAKLTILITLLLTTLTMAQQAINYKALIKDNLGNVVANQTVTVQFAILQGVSQTNVYQETHEPTTDANGFIIINIGEGTTTDDFSLIDWGSDTHFLNTQIDTGSGLTDMGATEFKAVPYALNAANVSGLEAIDELDGIGWRIIGRNPANYSFIGLNAVDFSYSDSESNTRGASGRYSTAMGFNTEASGNQSLAIGNQTISLGNSSVAMGFQTMASENFSTAMGIQTTASGNSSTAIGFQATASGITSTAIGRFIIADDDSSTVVGTYNDNSISSSSLFQVGNGTFEARSNAFNVDSDGTITAPSFDIAEITDPKALITKEYLEANGSTATGLEAIDEGNGTGYRLSGSDPTYYGNIGDRAVDLSYGGDTGYDAGLGAIGTGSVAMGEYTTASTGSVAMGYNSTASGQYATAMGNVTTASGLFTTAAGFYTVASALYATALGNTTIADDQNSTVIGMFNDHTLATNTLFQVGNGSNNDNRSNAFVVDNDGVIIAPSLDMSEITDNKALITKEYADANYSVGGGGTNPTGLEAIDEGNGIGWRMIGRDPNYYGNIGLNSIDISFSDINSSEFGATGNNSFAGGRSAIASGNTSIAFGMVNNASGDYSTAMGRETTASNFVSTAMGFQTTASGENSTAMGDSTIASNNAAIAMGVATVASGVFSTALGEATTASSRSTIAMGRGTIADDIHSAVVGQFNDNTSSTTTLFQVGNGGSTSNRSNAFNIDSDGTITAPSFDISEITNPKALITKEYLEANSSPATGLEAIDEGNGIGWRLAGRNPNNYGNIGNNAIDLSFNGLSSATHGASGSHSIALGIQTQASDFYSTAMGVNSNASGERSTAIGNGTLASGYASLAMGTATTASGVYSTAMGYNTIALNDYATAMGNQTTASGISSATAMGNNTLASAEYSTAMGYYTIASNSKSSALGNHSIADDNSSTVLGKYNDNTFSTTTLFQVGNGLNDSSRSNSLTVMENGYTSLGTHNEEPTADLQVNHGNGTLNGFKLQNQGTNNNWWRFYTLNSNGFLYLYSKAGGNTNNVGSFNDVSGAYAALSDRRVKDNFNELYFNWDSFMQLKPLTYYYKADESKQSQIGFIAQDVESIYPELVNYNTEDDLYQLNYSGFGVIAIKAIQEQQKVITSQQSRIEVLEAKLAEKDKAYNALSSRIESIESLLKTSNK